MPTEKEKAPADDQRSLTWKKRMKEFLTDVAGSVTLEPGILLHTLSIGIMVGPAIQTDLLLWKVCHLEMGYNETVCQNLDQEDNDDAQNRVQQRVNNFNIVANLLGTIPQIFYTCFAGALSDKYGRKPMIYAPMIGYFLSALLDCINYAFIRELPLEFFFLDQLRYVMGGKALYYMGLYLYATDCTKDGKRASRYGRFDGVVMLGYLIGLAMSQHLFKLGGNYLCYSATAVTTGTAIFHLWAIGDKGILSENKQPAKVENETAEVGALQKYVWNPFKESIQALIRPRKEFLRAYLYVCFFVYAMFFSTGVYGDQMYLYMRKVFTGVDPSEYATYQVFVEFMSVFSLFVLLPLMADIFKWHETTQNVVVGVCVTAASFLMAAAKNLWPDFYLVSMLSRTEMCQNALTRSVITKCVDKNEVGKIFSALALIVAVIPLISDPIMKKVYNLTVETWPQAFVLLMGVFYSLALLALIGLWTRKKAIEEAHLEAKEKAATSQQNDDSTTL